MNGLELLAEHVVRFNAGVRTGDFEPMLELFDEHAELAFEGIPVGPFQGLAAIRSAYREQPPDDELDILEAHELETSSSRPTRGAATAAGARAGCG